jgi:hypothetical protein
MRVNVFISYARDDGADFARHLRGHMREKGYEVFLDTASLSVGAKWKARIETAIDACDVFILIITSSSTSSNEVREEFASATAKRKLPMLFKYGPIGFVDLPWGLNERNLIEFDTKEDLVRKFADNFTEIDSLLTRDLTNPFEVQAKLMELKKEFDVIPDDIDKIKSYADDVFIPIITFLKKSPAFYDKEKLEIENVRDRAIKLSLDIDEKKESSEEVLLLSIDADNLKSNLSRFLDYLLNFFIKNTPEMRQQQTSELKDATRQELEESVQVDQMAAEEKDFLNISVDRDLPEKLKYEYFKQDIENQRIDIRYFFLGPDSVDLWFRIINDSEYKFHEYGRDNIKKSASELINVILENSVPATDYFDFIDLGVGAAVKDYYLLKPLLEKMPKNGQRVNYIPIDYSIGILQKTMDYMDKLMDSYPNKMHIEAILGDFFRLTRYTSKINQLSRSPKVFALLGNILGNVDEVRILNTITKTMNPNDLFLLEVDLIDQRTDDQLKVGYGSDEITKDFLLYPILKHFKTENKRTGTKIEDFELITDIQVMSVVPNSRTVVTSAYYGENYSEKIDLIQSHKYDLDSLLKFLYSTWKLEHIKTFRENNACLLLLRKLPLEKYRRDSPVIKQAEILQT